MHRLEKIKPLALLILRAALGAIFIWHGYPKLVTHPQDWAQNFIRMGFPSWFAYLSGVIELFGGGLVAAGLFTRIASLAIAIEMGVALWRVDVPHAGTLLNVGGYQTSLGLGAAALALAAVGAGAISLDYAIFKGKA